ncbi:MAG: hypothetical protein KatS3mg014_1414 [Actinomycetota bacterium]|nr:MAG: hypothetical protein KatS3mg014_1414 [Actinomycetota bacterium]
MPRRLRSVLRVSTTVALTVALLAPGPRAHAARSCLYYEFVKGTNVSSDLNWWYMDDYGWCIRVHNYRAGSGTTTDPCQINEGWLRAASAQVVYETTASIPSLIPIPPPRAPASPPPAPRRSP